MKITVTQKHIDEVAKRDCRNCPVALALNDATGKEWSVSNSYCYVEGLSVERIPLPCNAVGFIILFDKSKRNVAPFEFELP